MKAQYKNVVREGYEYQPIMELEEDGSDSRMCSVCKTSVGRRQSLCLGCDRYSVSVCLCDECLIVLHDFIGEYLERSD